MNTTSDVVRTKTQEIREPPVFPGLPVLGSLLDMRRNPLELISQASRLGDVVRLRFPSHTGYVVSHPRLVKEILVDRHRDFAKQTRGYRMLRLSLGQGLVTSEGDFWKRQRRIAQPAFHHHSISSFAEIMVRSTLECFDRWDAACRARQELDIDAEMMELTLKVVGHCLFSTDLSDQSNVVGPALTTVLTQTIRRITYPLAVPLIYPTPTNLRLKRALARLDELVYGLIHQRRESENPPNDLLGMLMSAEDEETGEGMTDQQLRDEILTLVLAGHETTANALAWTFYLLSKHPTIAEELGDEVKQVLGGRPPTLADLPQLPVTDSVLRESMRLYPPVWSVGRSVRHDDELGGYRLKRGAMTFVSPWVVHRDPRFWPNPEGFDPRRFRSDAMDSLPKYAYFPFSGGPRVCIGNGFAMMEGTLILATLMQRYRLALVPGQRIEPQALITLRPKYGIRMAVSRLP